MTEHASVHTCPRRMGGFGPWEHEENLDHWRTIDGTISCDFCGSISEPELFRLIELGAELGPTDKNYKVYVEHDSIRFGKFYFQHLSEEGRTRFVDLVNAKQLRIGYPGYFYRPPFFMRYVDPEQAPA